MIGCKTKKEYPEIEQSAYVHPTAVVIGKVMIGRNVFVGPGAVIRADEPGSFIIVGNNCNIQDNAVVHCLSDSSVEIGDNTSLAHNCVVHGPCRIGRGCFVGFSSVVFNSGLGDNTVIRHLAVVEGVKILAGKKVPSGTCVDSDKKTAELEAVTEVDRLFSSEVIKTNIVLAKGYRNA